ncbi:probable LRR receptor-like serine/threonine-protein kinase At1g67720 [Cryptomeria japonica]|uniref:probable LRR receptor-like serine/threonine-protein kinase At1g67720 n=1 Tax=Cryptomeria japonica TaxID=3369 RepID=UPI0025AD33CB|nr:probable LRR receptor-like serine/threonine-protein kinase At1g67720 [Cryptomeria japonica]
MDKLILRGRSLLMLTTNVLAFVVSVSAQPGFLSINCGGGDNYTDSVTNITWISDGNYIDVGEATNVSKSSIPYHLQSLRHFSKPLNKSCYSLPLNINVTYLVRLWFLFGNYNGIQELPSFNVSVETQGILIQKIQSITSPEIPEVTREMIITSSTNVIYVCLIRTSDSSDPFISAIELRSLSGGLYEAQMKPGMMLSSISRYDVGAQSSDLIRYPQDRFDRLWNSDSLISVLYNTTLIRKAHSNRTVLNKNNITSFPPDVVMQTARIGQVQNSTVIAKTTANWLRLILPQQNTRTLVVLYFAEVEILNGSEARNFNVMVNEQAVRYIDYALQNHSIKLPITYNYTQGNQPGKSSLGPLINAIEYYRIVESKPETDGGDVGALLLIKRAFSIKSWISDPCFGIEWTGIRCNKGLPVRIFDVDLSGRNLSGTVPKGISDLNVVGCVCSLQNNNLSGTLPDLCSLTKSEIIRLENNYLTGIIPDCLSQLSNLKKLYVSYFCSNFMLVLGMLILFILFEL